MRLDFFLLIRVSYTVQVCYILQYIVKNIFFILYILGLKLSEKLYAITVMVIYS